jgi:hypothetical protein
MKSGRRPGLQVRQCTFIIAVAALASALACGKPAPTTLVTIGVDGRTNSTPWVAADGSFVAVAWGASAKDSTDVFLAVSRDNGQTFSAPKQVNAIAGDAKLGGEFPPRVALAPRTGSAEPEVAVLWTAKGQAPSIKVARSRDAGATFEPAVTLQSPAAPGQRGWPALALDQKGVAHAIWLDHRGLASNHSAGAGHAGHQMTPKPSDFDSVEQAQKSGLYYANTSFSAAGSPSGSPSQERELTKGVCYCCKTSLIVSPAGDLFAAWRHVYPGDLRDMAFVVSRDGGRSFSEPVRVSEDGWAIKGCPDDGPAMTMDGKGTVHIAWPTVIDEPEPEGALFFSSTIDGKTFAARTRIPTLGLKNPSHVQLAADRKGRIMVAWDEFNNGQRVSSAREVTTDSGGKVTFGPAVTIAESAPATYPVLAATDAGMLAVWTTGGETPTVKARTIPWK